MQLHIFGPGSQSLRGGALGSWFESSSWHWCLFPLCVDLCCFVMSWSPWSPIKWL